MPRIKVCVRLRPESGRQCLQTDVPSNSVCVSVPKANQQHQQPQQNQAHGAGDVDNTPDVWNFKVNSVLPQNASQAAVYHAAASPIVADFLQGYNGTLLAYGQTGAGKTHSMTGPNNGSYDSRGVCARVISDVFRSIEQETEDTLTLRLSFLEVYNEQLYDLLNLDRSSPTALFSTGMGGGTTSALTGAGADTLAPPTSLTISDRGPHAMVEVKGLTCPAASTEEEALGLLFEAQMNRSIAEHQLNHESSRSHFIFTLYLSRARTNVQSSSGSGGGGAREAAAELVESKLNIVDLAGSERVNKTGSTGTVQREANFINKSLSFLEQVVVAAAERDREHIPFRQSKLTHVLQDCIGGNCRTAMLACLWPREDHVWECLSTLRFASRMMLIRNQAVVNTVKDGSAPRALLEQLARVKRELALRDLISGRVPSAYGPVTESQRATIRNHVSRYVLDPAMEIEVVTLSQVREVFSAMRQLAWAACGGDEDQVRQLLHETMRSGSPRGRQPPRMQDVVVSAGASSGPVEHLQQQEHHQQQWQEEEEDPATAGVSGEQGPQSTVVDRRGEVGFPEEHQQRLVGSRLHDATGGDRGTAGNREDAVDDAVSVASIGQPVVEQRLGISRGSAGSEVGAGDGVSAEKAQAFEEFRASRAVDQDRRYQELKAAVKDKKAEVRRTAQLVNASKAIIDALTAQQTQTDPQAESGIHGEQPGAATGGRGGDGGSENAEAEMATPAIRVGSAAEQRSSSSTESDMEVSRPVTADQVASGSSLIIQLRQQKARYRELYDRLSESRAAVKYLQQQKQDAFQHLVTTFEAWWQRHGGSTSDLSTINREGLLTEHSGGLPPLAAPPVGSSASATTKSTTKQKKRGSTVSGSSVAEPHFGKPLVQTMAGSAADCNVDEMSFPYSQTYLASGQTSRGMSPAMTMNRNTPSPATADSRTAFEMARQAAQMRATERSLRELASSKLPP